MEVHVEELISVPSEPELPVRNIEMPGKWYKIYFLPVNILYDVLAVIGKSHKSPFSAHHGLTGCVPRLRIIDPPL